MKKYLLYGKEVKFKEIDYLGRLHLEIGLTLENKYWCLPYYIDRPLNKFAQSEIDDILEGKVQDLKIIIDRDANGLNVKLCQAKLKRAQHDQALAQWLVDFGTKNNKIITKE